MPLLPVGNGKFVEIDEEDVVATCWYEWHLNSDPPPRERGGFLEHACLSQTTFPRLSPVSHGRALRDDNDSSTVQRST